jgi:hypothetical protein
MKITGCTISGDGKSPDFRTNQKTSQTFNEIKNEKRIETEASEIKDEDLDNRAKTKIKKTMLKKKIRKTKILKMKLRSKQRNSFPVENAENYSEVESE